MADKYATIQQHQPLRVPPEWGQSGKVFVSQLEEVLDDVYRRFGRLRFEDLGTKLQNRLEDDEGYISSLEQTTDSISMTVAKKARTFSQATQPTSTSDYTLVDGDLWIDTDDGNKTYRYNGSSWVETSDANKYSIQSGVAINALGVEVTGGKYVNIKSGGKLDVDATNFKINSDNKNMKIENWTFDNTGLVITYTEGSSQSKMGLILDSSINPSPGLMYKSGPLNYTAMAVMSVFNSRHQSQQRKMGTLVVDNISSVEAVIDEIEYAHLHQASSRELKHDIQLVEEIGERLDQLEPVTFVYNDDKDERTRYGLIYEDAVEVMPEICTAEGESKAINYVELVPMLLKEIQSLRKRVAELEGKVYV